MLPVYFPFTGVDDRLMDALSRFFKRIAVYQVTEAAIPARMKKWRDEQRLDIRLPFQRYEREIVTLLRAYNIWAQHHQGGDISFFRAQRDNIPFFSDSSVAQIRKEIKAKRDGNTVLTQEQPPELLHGIFLQMAQDLDEKNREVAGELKSQAMREHALMQALKGDELLEALDASGPRITADHRPAYMIYERMTAWAHLMLSDSLSSPMLITSHGMVLDDLIERIPGGSGAVVFLQSITAPTGEAGHIARQKDALRVYLEDLSVRPFEGEAGLPRYACDHEAGDPGARLSLYLIPGMTPRELLDRYVRSQNVDNPENTQDNIRNNNTLLGLMELIGS